MSELNTELITAIKDAGHDTDPSKKLLFLQGAAASDGRGAYPDMFPELLYLHDEMRALTEDEVLRRNGNSAMRACERRDHVIDERGQLDAFINSELLDDDASARFLDADSPEFWDAALAIMVTSGSGSRDF